MIRRCKKIVSLILYGCGLLGALRTLRRMGNGNGRYIILMYHRIWDAPHGFPSVVVSPKRFERHLAYLMKHYCVISLDEMVERIESGEKPSRDYVAITFDDGYEDNHSQAQPLLKKYRMPATLFLTAGYIDTPKLLWWDRAFCLVQSARALGNLELDEEAVPPAVRQPLANLLSQKDDPGNIDWFAELLKRLTAAERIAFLDYFESAIAGRIMEHPNRPRMLSWNQVRQLSRENIAFGGHTVNHPILTEISEEDACCEVAESISAIERETKLEVKHFAYPNGKAEDFDNRTIDILRAAGLKSACTTIPGFNQPGAELYQLKRKHVGEYGQAEFAAELEGYFDFLRSAKRPA